MIRLVNVDDVRAIMCKYENRLILRTMIYQIELLNSCTATEEQEVEILGNKKITMED